ncbi:MAG: nucleotidyltransferase [Chloroflexi bacterium]|nr:nucleotidyltransferase [Chloroflexota bacterium]
MSEPASQSLPLTTLHDLVRWLHATAVPGIVIGGVAASVLGRPRATRDVDAVVWLDPEGWPDLLAAGAQFGFIPRRPDALPFARQSRVLLVHHAPSGVDVDISFGALPFEKEAIERHLSVEVGGVSIPLPTPEDLIVMKAIAHRQRDVADIESLLDAHPRLDLRRVRRWVREFSAVLEMPEILNDLEAMLARWERKKP